MFAQRSHESPLLRPYTPPDEGDAAEIDGRYLVAESPSLVHLVQQAQRVAPSKATVLIEGESGTGKELLARLVHDASPRKNKPYLCVNCAAFSDTLIESELFGHEKGSFTGAGECRKGRFELADGGTLLLDEIGEMSLKLQTKLLRVLEERSFERVGGMKSLKVDVRVLATTNRDLEREVSAGNFRLDLYYRLNAVHFRIPPLRERPEDIVPLTQHFLEGFNAENPHPVKGLHPHALRILREYTWPGNVRQLRNVIQHASVLAPDDLIQVSDLPKLRESGDLSTYPSRSSGRTLAEMERALILETLREVGGNQTVAAQRLGVTARTLHNKLRKYRAADAA